MNSITQITSSTVKINIKFCGQQRGNINAFKTPNICSFNGGDIIP